MCLFTSNWQTKITQLPLNENAHHFFLNGGLDKPYTHETERDQQTQGVGEEGRRGGGWGLIDLDLEFSSDVFNNGDVTLYLKRRTLEGFVTLSSQAQIKQLSHTHTYIHTFVFIHTHAGNEASTQAVLLWRRLELHEQAHTKSVRSISRISEHSLLFTFPNTMRGVGGVECLGLRANHYRPLQLTEMGFFVSWKGRLNWIIIWTERMLWNTASWHYICMTIVANEILWPSFVVFFW